MSEATETTIPLVALMALQAENEALRQEVREWLCESCNWVYPGPPQPGVMCVICPRCKGFTGPFTSTKLRIAEKELKELRAVVARARELIEEGHHSTSGPCETCKAFIVLINSVPAPSSSAPKEPDKCTD